MSQTQAAIRRLIDAIQSIQSDPIYVGHVPDRLVRMVHWSIDSFNKYKGDPVRSRDRINYHACGVASATGEFLLLLEDPKSTVVCQGAGIRSDSCKKLISHVLKSKSGEVFPTFVNVCRHEISSENR